MTIPANDLKTKGISAIENQLKDEQEAVITVRGKEKYIVLDLERYNFLRECELQTALALAQKEVKEGKYVTESVDEHMKKLSNYLKSTPITHH
jgi:PHD/YefM family antitoxin component YafN of YafNO toxin-antitoxin module